MSDQDPYVVEPDISKACRYCGAGTMFMVVFKPNDTATSTAYGLKEDAEDMAAELNGAYWLGVQDGEA